MRFVICISALAWMACSALAFDQNHSSFDKVLKAVVDKQGLVNYKMLHDHPAELKAYLHELGGVSEKELTAWSRDEKLAFWINAYNAFTLKAIIDHYPIKRDSLKGLAFPANSIRQISGVWDKLTWKVAGMKLTLNQIEHEKLRAELKEPRIHFAINCASIGCPLLEDFAFRADRLDEQLNGVAKAFVQHPQKVRLDRKANRLYLSKIFEWFGEDFAGFDEVEGYGKLDGVVSFVSSQMSDANKAFVRKSRPAIKWLDYDWTLNEQK